MREFLLRNKGVLIVIVMAVAAGYVGGTLLVRDRLEEITAVVKLDTATQLTILASLTEAMSRGGADSVTEEVIKDCSADERIRFDDLLSRLASGLSRSDLVEVSRLFDRCGAFYSRQKAVMAARLEREVQVYEQAVERQVLLTGEDRNENFAINSWQELVRLEKEQSAQYARLVDLQGHILSALLDGETASSQKITTLLDEVHEVLEMQSYNAMKLRETREVLPTAL